MKILLLTQDIHGKGGVGNYFKILEKKFHKHVDYMIDGTRANEKSKLSGVVRFFSDIFKFWKIVRNYDLIHINTSMRIKSFVRDAIFALLTKMYGKKCLVFIHGWDKKFSRIICRYFMWLYKAVFFKADGMIVLSKEFCSILKNWGFPHQIFLLTTLVDDDLLSGVDETTIAKKCFAEEEIKILFLARIEKQKGIYEAIEACHILGEEFLQIKLVVAGDGSELERAKAYVTEHRYSNVQFVGFVTGLQKIKVFMDSDLYILPSYSEGMPTSMLEAMAFGLPIITRPVGGINDFFEQGKMGLTDESRDPQEIASLLKKLVVDRKLSKKMSLYNYRYVQNNFLASQVLVRLENIYNTVGKGSS